MIRPPRGGGVAFTEAGDGDMRADLQARAAVAARLGISEHWSTVWQVHGAVVAQATSPGESGAADALFTTVAGLPLAVFTADCLGVVIEAEGGVGVAHAGWRGLTAGVIPALLGAMRSAGLLPRRAWIGQAIGPCCYEVGPEVTSEFPGHVASTTWGTPSVDLWSAAEAQLQGLEVWCERRCTRHLPGSFSHRADATSSRMAAVGWWPA